MLPTTLTLALSPILAVTPLTSLTASYRVELSTRNHIYMLMYNGKKVKASRRGYPYNAIGVTIPHTQLKPKKSYKVEIKRSITYVIDVLAENETEARKKANEKWYELNSETEHYYEKDNEIEDGNIYDVTGTDDAQP